MSQAVGVDIGGTKTSVALVDADGAHGAVLRAPTPTKQGGVAVLDTAAELISRVADPARLAGIGVGASGVVDASRGVVVSSTDTFADWVGTDIAGGLCDRLGLAERQQVQVLNDVDAHAMGELWLGAGRDHSSLLLLAVGTGVGGALVLGGKLWTGARHVAGEVGHLPVPGAENERCPCGRMGHLEGVAAGPAIERRYAELAGVARPGRQIMALAADGDEVALGVVEHAASTLGRAIAGLATTLDPALVVIGGGFALAGDVWWRPLRAALAAEVVDALTGLPVVRAALGPEAAIVGAARVVFQGGLHASRDVG